MPQKTENKNNKVKFETIKKRIEEARIAHSKWWKGEKGQAKQSYEYRETNQVPKDFPRNLKVYCQINKIKESHDAQMGILLGSDPEWEVSGRGRDFMDRERTKLVKAVMEMVGEEAKLIENLIDVYDDFNLPGMAALRVRWDPHYLTNMNTLGMLNYDVLPLDGIRLDSHARHPDKGRFSAYEKDVTKEEFIEEWADYYYQKFGKKLNVDKIFKVATQEQGIDWQKNLNRNKDEQILSVIQYEYWRKINVILKHPDTGEVISNEKNKAISIPKRDYRIAIAAGDRVWEDNKSPLSRWSVIYFYNSRIFGLPYSQSDFPAQRAIQDVINTWISMLLNSNAKQLTAKRVVYSGSLSNPEQLKESSDSDIIEWDAESLLGSGINPLAARPEFENRPPLDVANFRLLEILFQKYEGVSVKDVLKGREPTGVKSGYGINLLQTAGLQPSQYHKRKLSVAHQKLGASSWELVRKNLDEIELPVYDDTGEAHGKPINKPIDPVIVLEMMEVISSGQNIMPDHPLKKIFPDIIEIQDVQEKLNMITVRDGDDRMTIKELADEVKSKSYDIIKAESEEKGKVKKNIEFILNDLSFGSFDVSLKIDPLAEQSRQEKLQKVQLFMPMIQGAGAPITALEYALKAVDEPDRAELLKKVKEESKAWQTIQQQQELGQQPQQGEVENASGF